MVEAENARVRFFTIFYSVFGWKVWLVLGLNIFGTLSEALGIVLLLPLLTSFSPGSPMEIEGLGFIGTITTGLIDHLQVLIPSVNTFTLLVIVIGFFFVIKGLFTFIAYVVVNILNGRMMYTLRSETLSALSKSEFSFFRAKMTGFYTNVLGEQVQRSFLAVKYISEFAGKASSTFVYIGIALYIDWQFGLFAASLGVVIVLSFRSLNRKVRDMSILNSKYSTDMQSSLIEYIKSFKYFKATGSEDLLTPKVHASFAALSSVRIKTGIYDSFTLALREPLLVIMVLTLIYIEVSYFESPISSILVSILLFYRALNSTVVAQRQWQAGLEYFGGLHAATELLSAARNNVEPTGTMTADMVSPNLAMKNVEFSYLGRGDFSLNLAAVNIPENSTVAIIGQGHSRSEPVLIERGAWIGAGVIILPGVTIGRNAVVGAGSVETKNIHAFSIAVGNPARVVRTITKN